MNVQCRFIEHVPVRIAFTRKDADPGCDPSTPAPNKERALLTCPQHVGRKHFVLSLGLKPRVLRRGLIIVASIAGGPFLLFSFHQL